MAFLIDIAKISLDFSQTRENVQADSAHRCGETQRMELRRRSETMRRKRMRRKKDSLGLFQVLLFGTFFYLWSFVGSSPVGTHTLHAETSGLPFRPIGSPSAVDQFQNEKRYAETAYHDQQNVPRRANFSTASATRAAGNVRQVSMQSGGFALPPGGGTVPSPSEYTPPPLNTPPAMTVPNLQTAPATSQPQFTPPPSTSAPSNVTTPRSLPTPGSVPNSGAPSTFNSGGLSSSPGPIADYQPVAPPQLSNGGFATASDCRLITPASNYSAMSPYGDTCGCGDVMPTGYAGTYVPPPAQIPAPAAMPSYTVTPPPTTAVTTPPSAAPVGSLVTFGQETLPVQVGQGLWGQPVAYVPGQRFRNWLRYFSF
ncbi:MAG: hypothetical protein ACF787_06605 [Rhodopirellula sp. JB053]